MDRLTARDGRFIEYLEQLAEREDRAALAALRRGLGKAPGEAAEMHPHVVRFLPYNSHPQRDEVYYLVAALFAWHPQPWHGDEEMERLTNLGASFARLSRQDESDSIEKRFVALLNCHRDDLPDHLRQAVGLLRAHEIPVDWAQLLRDIHGWGWESRSVQRAWARAFWGQPDEEAPEADAAAADAADIGDLES